MRSAEVLSIITTSLIGGDLFEKIHLQSQWPIRSLSRAFRFGSLTATTAWLEFRECLRILRTASIVKAMGSPSGSRIVTAFKYSGIRLSGVLRAITGRTQPFGSGHF